MLTLGDLFNALRTLKPFRKIESSRFQLVDSVHSGSRFQQGGFIGFLADTSQHFTHRIAIERPDFNQVTGPVLV